MNLEDLNTLLGKILKENYSDEDLKKLLEQLGGIENLDDLKSIVEGCLKGKPKDVTELLNCVQNKIVEANSNKINEEQKRRRIKIK
ncbi:hypothetical protein [Rheinheimera sp. KL1]|uniref:hypothetical protein n=1 Tax=Rheinheimera sp. KL1 TaxID=1635005 RepID=UPI0012665957|nr:hypothetical protein [Rheinheimera sp. KL1]